MSFSSLGCRFLTPWRSYFPGLFLLFLASSMEGQVSLNEVMANNLSAVTNGGNTPDWIELYNSTGAAVSIANYSLTDSTSTPLKYVFPAGTTLPALGRLVVWCDTDVTAARAAQWFQLEEQRKNGVLLLPGRRRQIGFHCFWNSTRQLEHWANARGPRRHLDLDPADPRAGE